MPTATMRPPARRAALSASAVSASTRPIRHACGGRRCRRLDRQEGAGADMQRHACAWRCRVRASRRTSSAVKCSAGGRRRDRALARGEHGLVVGAVALVGRAARGDVGRQRHVAAFGDRLSSTGAVEREGQRHLAALALVLDGRVELAEEADAALVAEADDVARRSRFAGLTKARQREPSSRWCSVASIRGSLAAADAPAVQPRRDHLGVVDDERVARAQQIRQIAHRRSASSGVSPAARPAAAPHRAARIGRSAMRSGGRSKSNRSRSHAPVLARPNPVSPLSFDGRKSPPDLLGTTSTKGSIGYSISRLINCDSARRPRLRMVAASSLSVRTITLEAITAMPVTWSDSNIRIPLQQAPFANVGIKGPRANLCF